MIKKNPEHSFSTKKSVFTSLLFCRLRNFCAAAHSRLSLNTSYLEKSRRKSDLRVRGDQRRYKEKKDGRTKDRIKRKRKP